nr:unnamed protein product [Meloidogyne enterolobii]
MKCALVVQIGIFQLRSTFGNYLKFLLYIWEDFFFDGKKNNRFMEFPMKELDINYLHPNSADNE